MDGLQGALEPGFLPQFLEGHIGFGFQQAFHLLPVPGQDQRLAPGQMVPRADVPDVAALLEQLLDHAQGDPEAVCHLVPRCPSLVISLQNPFPQIQ